MEDQIQQTQKLPQELAQHGKISLTSTQISKQIGQLFIERSDVNLTSDILDTPEYFWENDEHLTFFKRVKNYLEIGTPCFISSMLSAHRAAWGC